MQISMFRKGIPDKLNIRKMGLKGLHSVTIVKIQDTPSPNVTNCMGTRVRLKEKDLQLLLALMMKYMFLLECLRNNSLDYCLSWRNKRKEALKEPLYIMLNYQALQILQVYHLCILIR